MLPSSDRNLVEEATLRTKHRRGSKFGEKDCTSNLALEFFPYNRNCTDTNLAKYNPHYITST
jgi:hypothetical protein